MEFETDSIEAVDIPPDLQLELNSARSIDSLPSLRSSQKHASSFDASKFQAFPDGLSASSSSIDSLNMLVERQRMRQLNHPQHQEHMTDAQGLIQQADVKETNEIFLKYDPISKRKVLNTYEIIKELGLGQHGKVKLARDLLTKQLVAIKIVDRHEKKERKFFRIKKTNSLTQSDKIKREIAIMKKCHYKHVVRLIEVLDDSKSRKIYLVLEYCSKGEVKWCPRDQMETEAHGPPLLSFQRTREIIRGVVLGLEYLHYQGVIHRDIKPANLLISGDGTVKISDFGVSLAATGSNSNESMESVDELELAKTAGTPAFFAPEICLGNEAFEKYNLKREELFKGSSISFMIDIWALGVTLYCLLFGMLPFISDYELELFEKIVNQPVSFPTYEEIKSNGISVVSCQEEYEAAKDIVNKLLEKNPMKRICIPEIKKHPMMCWDFEHLSSTDDEHITSKLEEIKEFQSNKEQLFKQISVSKRELKNAVLGVGKKIKESVFNTLPVNRRSSSKGESESVSTLHSDFDPKLASKKCSDSSFIVSEGSVVSNLGDVSTAAQYTNDKNFDESDNKNNDKQARNAISLKSNSPELFKKGYSICNGNDNNDNEMTKEASQREMFEQELQKFDDKHDPKTIVNLPINSSFASLDSFYIDNYAMSNVGSNNDMGNRDSKITSSIFARPPSVSAIYPPSGGRRQNSNTIGNRLRSSSSRLDFLNSGIQSTRNERVPYNHSRFLQHSGRSGTDITLQHPSVGSSMSFGGKVNRKQAFNKPNEDNRSPSTNETESRKPATSNHQKVDNSKDNVKNFQIKRGNFFSSFNGQDEETSHSSGASSSGSSSYSSSSESDSEGSYAESLPFEFGVDSSNGSVVSMREVTGLDHVRPFMEVHSPRHASRKGSLDNGRQNKRNIGIQDDDENDDLVLSMGSAGRQRRQDSSQTSGSSAGSSRRNTLPYLYQGRGSDGAPAVDSVCTITPGNLTTISPHLWASGRQRSEEAPAELLNSSSKSSLSSGNANISHVSIHPSSASNLQYSNPGSTSGSLLVPLSNVKPTTQALNVDGILSKGRHQERFHDNSRKLLKTVLITSAEADRRQSVPSLTPSAQSSQRIPSSRINDTSVYTTSAPNHEQHHLEGRPSHNVVHEAPAKNEIRRSRSITIAELRKNKP